MEIKIKTVRTQEDVIAAIKLIELAASMGVTTKVRCEAAWKKYFEISCVDNITIEREKN